MLQLWYVDWEPDWLMTEMCYDGCKKLDPPQSSNTTAFFFNKVDNEYKLKAMYINTPDEYFYSGDSPLISCNEHKKLVAPTSIPRCPGSPAQRLIVGKSGQVCTRTDPVIFRAKPGKTGKQIGLLPTGTKFSVVKGPECAGNYWSWWKVRLEDGRLGWLAEGGDACDEYFLCPTE